MSQFFKIDNEGKIVGASDFTESDSIPNDYKKAWDTKTYLQEPYWSFASNSWAEDIYSPVFLTEAKEIKKEDLKEMCQTNILNGFDSMFKGLLYHFSYDREAQLNFQDSYNLFQNNLMEEIGWTVRLNEEKIRIKLDKASFIEIYTNAIKHKNENINHLYEVLIPKVELANNLEEIRTIQWGNHENSLAFKTDEMLDKKINEIALIEKETSAQKGHNMYIETTLMEVVDIIFAGM